VMEAFCFGFLATSAAMSPALRLSDMLGGVLMFVINVVECFNECTRSTRRDFSWSLRRVDDVILHFAMD
jgi:hypothetical protein